MELSALQLWQRAALQPSEKNAPLRRTRRRSDTPTVSREWEACRAREAYRRMRDTVASGLVLSLLLGAPVGWSFVESVLLRQDPAAAEACPAVSSFLPPALERQLKDLGAAGALSKGERQLLSMKVCDPSLRLVLGPLLKGVSDLGELKALSTGREAGAVRAMVPTVPLTAVLGW